MAKKTYRARIVWEFDLEGDDKPSEKQTIAELRQMVYEELVTHAIVSHHMSCMEWMCSTEENADLVAKHHREWADRLKGNPAVITVTAV